MTLIRINQLSSHVRLALWQMTERVEDMVCPPMLDLSDIRSEHRRKEKLVAYEMLHALTGRRDLLIQHEASGRPFIEGYKVSISHTRGWAAMMLSDDEEVGVDIEYQSDRVNKIVERFMRPDEDGSSLDRRLINWCAKEAVYKLRSPEDLQYFEMRVRFSEEPRTETSLLSSAKSLSEMTESPAEKSTACAPEGIVQVDDLKKNETLMVNYEKNNNYVLAWVMER